LGIGILAQENQLSFGDTIGKYFQLKFSKMEYKITVYQLAFAHIRNSRTLELAGCPKISQAIGQCEPESTPCSSENE
jgi:hypothetical protein